LNKRGGKSLAVYNPASEEAFRQAYALQRDSRVLVFGPADYTEGSHTSRVIERVLREMVEEKIELQEEEIRRRASPGPKHIA